VLLRRVRSHAADLDFESGLAGVDQLIDHKDRGLEARDRQITGECGVELILDAIGRDSLKKGYQQRAVFQQRRDLVRGFGSTRRTRLANGDR